MVRRITSLLVSAVMTATALVGLGVATAPVAQAANCYYTSKVKYIEVDAGVTKGVTIRLYVCDYGSYVRYQNIRFTGSGTYFRDMYDNGPDTNIRMRCAGNSSYVQVLNRSRYVRGTVYGLGNVRCNKTAYLNVDLTADVKWWPDGTLRHEFRFNPA